MELKHILYPTIAKPIDIRGIPLIWWGVVVLSGGTSSLMFSFIMGGVGYLIGPLIGLIMWAVGYVFSRNDPEFAEVWFKKRIVLKDTKSNFKHRRYEP